LFLNKAAVHIDHVSFLLQGGCSIDETGSKCSSFIQKQTQNT